jgi:hypothetical protein
MFEVAPKLELHFKEKEIPIRNFVEFEEKFRSFAIDF